LLTQIARILEVNGLSQLTKAVVEESRASLLPNNVEKKTPNNLESHTILIEGFWFPSSFEAYWTRKRASSVKAPREHWLF
jgi:hypothetical protein